MVLPKVVGEPLWVVDRSVVPEPKRRVRVGTRGCTSVIATVMATVSPPLRCRVVLWRLPSVVVLVTVPRVGSAVSRVNERVVETDEVLPAWSV